MGATGLRGTRRAPHPSQSAASPVLQKAQCLSQESRIDGEILVADIVAARRGRLQAVGKDDSGLHAEIMAHILPYRAEALLRRGKLEDLCAGIGKYQICRCAAVNGDDHLCTRKYLDLLPHAVLFGCDLDEAEGGEN